MKFKAKPRVRVAEALLGRYDWLKERLDKDGYVHGYYVDGYIVGDVIDSDDKGFQPEFWCPIDKSTLEVVNNQPWLTIPIIVSTKLDKGEANDKTVIDWVFAKESEVTKRRAIVSIYGASRVLDVDLVKVVEG